LGELDEALPWINIREKRDVCWSWDNLSLSIFVNKTVGSGQADEITKFIRAFKASDDDECLKTAIVELYKAAGEYIEEWKRQYNCRYVVPVPSSRAHEISRYSKAMCGFIARMFHLEYREGLLFRERTVPSSHMAAYWQRLSVKEQFDSLGCRETNLAGAGVTLFDDVRNIGNTSQACRRRLRDDAKCSEVIRPFLDRTQAECE
jgi:predicted amidophosphoribosyltransferase